MTTDWQGQSGGVHVYVAPDRITKEVNRRVAAGAERFVFYHEERDWIPKLSDKLNPYLSRIFWPRLGAASSAPIVHPV